MLKTEIFGGLSSQRKIAIGLLAPCTISQTKHTLFKFLKRFNRGINCNVFGIILKVYLT
jgi:hypothetical protein